MYSLVLKIYLRLFQLQRNKYLSYANPGATLSTYASEGIYRNMRRARRTTETIIHPVKTEVPFCDETQVIVIATYDIS